MLEVTRPARKSGREGDPATVAGQAPFDDAGGLVAIHEHRHWELVDLRHGRPDKVRANDVDLDAGGGMGVAQAFAVGANGGLACTTRRSAGEATEGGDARHQSNLAARLVIGGPWPLEHTRDGWQYSVEDAREIDVEYSPGLISRFAKTAGRLAVTNQIYSWHTMSYSF